MPKLTIKQFQQGIDLNIESMEKQKQWYLDYRCGSGMTPMLEEFAKIIDSHIEMFKLIKQFSNTIEPTSLLGKLP